VQQLLVKDNVVLELNGLKFAEVRSIVDCANYIFSTLLQMCMPAPSHIKPAYRSLFSDQNLDLSQMEDKKRYLAILKGLLAEWAPVLRRFIKDDDDQVSSISEAGLTDVQVELLFTFEEFFKGEGVFNREGHWGKELGPIVSNICHLLYDEDIVTEEAFMQWAAEKETATDPDGLVFFHKANLDL